MNHFLRLDAILGSLLLTMPFAAAARGELITVEFAGTVTSVTVQPVLGIQDFDFPDPGDPFTGFYVFDSTAQDSANSPEQGSFNTELSDSAVGVSIGEFQFEGPASVIVTFQSIYAVGDGIPHVELTSNAELAAILDDNNFGLVVTRENMFSDPNILPLSPPSLAGTEHRSLRMTMDSRLNSNEVPYVDIRASLELLAVVPEPSSFLLGKIVLLLLLQAGSRRRNQSEAGIG